MPTGSSISPRKGPTYRSLIPRERPRPTPRPMVRAARRPAPSRADLSDVKARPHRWRLALKDPPPLVPKYCHSLTPADSTISASASRRHPAPPDGIEWMSAENELLFPPYVIPHLARAGGGGGGGGGAPGAAGRPPP